MAAPHGYFGGYGVFLFGIYRKMLGVLIADLIEKWYNSNVFCCIRYGGKYGGFI